MPGNRFLGRTEKPSGVAGGSQRARLMGRIGVDANGNRNIGSGFCWLDRIKQMVASPYGSIHLNVTGMLPRESAQGRHNGISSTKDLGSRVRTKQMEPSMSSVEMEGENIDEIFLRIKAKDFSREAEIFKALGHPIRLKIVYGLLQVGGCNVKNMQECLGLHQATVSQHLIHLKSRGIISSTRKGLEMIYSVTEPMAKCIVEMLDEMVNDPRCSE